MCYGIYMDHGKTSTYTNHGCRCDECKRAMKEYQAARRELKRTGFTTRGEMRPPVSSFIEHGTTTAYCYHACRCDDCRKAWRLYRADLRERKRTGGYVHTLHATHAMWLQGCRCTACELAEEGRTGANS